MIVCKICGNRNNDQEEFCTSCGRYLAWSGEHVDVAAESEPELVPEDAYEEARRPPGFFRRLAIGLHLVAPPSHPARSDQAPAGAVPGSAAAWRGGAGGDGDEGVAVLGTLPRGAAASLAAAPAAGLASGSASAAEAGGGRGESVLVVPEIVGTDDVAVADAGTAGSSGGRAEVGAGDVATVNGRSATAPMALIGGTAEAAPVLRPRRPGETGPQLPVLPPLPGREPPASDRGTVLRRPTEVVNKPRARRARGSQLAGVPELPSTPNPGDIFCARCGQFNAPTRVYCRRCGLELSARALADDEIAYQPLTWWQRHVSHDVRVVGAGGRPGRWGKIVAGAGSQGRTMRILSRVGAAVLAVFLVISLVGPYKPGLDNWYTNTYHSVYNWLNAKEVGVNASGANATSQATNHGAFLAVDGAFNTYWESAPVQQPSPIVPKPSTKAGAHGKGASKAPATAAVYPVPCRLWPPSCTPRPVPVIPGVGQVLTIDFSPAVSINRIAWLNGASGSLANFDSIGRPHKVLLGLPGNRHVVEYLQDVQSLQTFHLTVSNLSRMTVTVESTYAGASVPAVAITEIEFFHRQ